VPVSREFVCPVALRLACQVRAGAVFVEAPEGLALVVDDDELEAQAEARHAASVTRMREGRDMENPVEVAESFTKSGGATNLAASAPKSESRRRYAGFAEIQVGQCPRPDSNRQVPKDGGF
jgi:hypothetical protein